MKLFQHLLLILLFTSCNTPSEKTVDIIDEPVPKTESQFNINVTGCYMQIRNRDTIIAILKQNGIEVTGKLKFDNYQIDGSSGTLKGVVEGDVLKLKYDFFSEGMNSIMDIYFKYNNDSLIRGVGDMKTSSDSTLFINTSAIQYPNETVLKKLKCEDVKF